MDCIVRALKIHKDENCPVCGKNPSITSVGGYDYEYFCGIKTDEDDEEPVEAIEAKELKRRLDAGDKITVVDVREPHERAIVKFPDALVIPIGQLARRQNELDKSADTVFICKEGKRSILAANTLREAGFEYGAKTGRPRRVGPIDLVATRYGVEIQGATDIALTKLDVLSYMDQIPVCAHYELDGKVTDEFSFPCALDDAKPVIEYFPGWKTDISGARKWEDLPENARKYVEMIEQAIGCHITYVSVGPERDAYIYRA